MDKISSEISNNTPTTLLTASAERRTLSDVVHSAKRSGGSYGSLAKSQLQPTVYICHKVEAGDTMQRLALKYSVNVQEIKRVNKLWSDAELSLLGDVNIPVNSSQLSTLRNLYPTLNVVQSPFPSNSQMKKSASSSVTNDQTNSLTQSSDTSTPLPSTMTVASSYEDYLSKIDRQIQTSKNSLKSLDVDKKYSKVQSNDAPSPSLSHDNVSDQSNSSPNSISSTTTWNHGRPKGTHHLLDNSVFVNVTTSNSRERHISAALERIRRERDDFDEL